MIKLLFYFLLIKIFISNQGHEKKEKITWKINKNRYYIINI